MDKDKKPTIKPAKEITEKKPPRHLKIENTFAIKEGSLGTCFPEINCKINFKFYLDREDWGYFESFVTQCPDKFYNQFKQLVEDKGENPRTPTLKDIFHIENDWVIDFSRKGMGRLFSYSEMIPYDPDVAEKILDIVDIWGQKRDVYIFADMYNRIYKVTVQCKDFSHCSSLNGEKFIMGKHFNAPDIRFKLFLYKEEWEYFKSFIIQCKDEFLTQFNLFVRNEDRIQAIKRLPRGKHWKTDNLVRNIQDDSAFLYVMFQYWKDKPLEQFPEDLQKIVNKAEADGYREYIKLKDGTFDPKGLTQYWIKKVWGKEIEKYRLIPYDDPDNFYKTYILPQRNIKYLMYIENQPEERTFSDEFTHGSIISNTNKKQTEEQIRSLCKLSYYKHIFEALEVI